MPAYLAAVAGYLQLLSQLTKVGDYDEATFKGKRRQAAGRTQGDQPALLMLPLNHTSAPYAAARFDEMSKRSDTYKVAVIEGEPWQSCSGRKVSWLCHWMPGNSSASPPAPSCTCVPSTLSPPVRARPGQAPDHCHRHAGGGAQVHPRLCQVRAHRRRGGASPLSASRCGC